MTQGYNQMTVSADKIDRIETAIVAVEKAVIELTTLQKESAKREERIMSETQKSEARIQERLREERERTGEKFADVHQDIEELKVSLAEVRAEVKENTLIKMKALGILTALIFVSGVAMKFWPQ